MNSLAATPKCRSVGSRYAASPGDLRAQALAAAARVLRVGESGEASDDGEEEGGKDALANIELTPIPASQIDHDGVDGEAASLDSISRS